MMGIKRAALAAMAAFTIAGSAQAALVEYVQNGGFENLSLINSGTWGAAGSSVAAGNYQIGDLSDQGAILGGTGGVTPTGWSTSGYNFVFQANTADSAATGALTNFSGGTGPDDRFSLNGPGQAVNPVNNGFVGESPAGGAFLVMDSNLVDTSGIGNLTLPISQQLTGLTAGNMYKVSFYWAAAQQYGFTGETFEGFRVGLGDSVIPTNSGPNEQFDDTEANIENLPACSFCRDTGFVVNPDQGFTDWQKVDFYFTASNSTQVLSFLATGGPQGQPPFSLLDGISVTDAPEPATWAMMLIGFGAVGGALRRRGGKLLPTQRPALAA
ncbi:PEPxxWA-CTERM sorting domain-containing protein [Sphingomonas montanisoli]|nr:PEPxxWA-CTERM sorting domain-containing protein [Sphingomonas montanisoli]